jgi:hypothetical protein
VLAGRKGASDELEGRARAAHELDHDIDIRIGGEIGRPGGEHRIRGQADIPGPGKVAHQNGLERNRPSQTRVIQSAF